MSAFYHHLCQIFHNFLYGETVVSMCVTYLPVIPEHEAWFYQLEISTAFILSSLEKHWLLKEGASRGPLHEAIEVSDPSLKRNGIKVFHWLIVL